MFTHEIISYQKNLPIKLYFQRIGDVSKHWHRSMELLLVLQGEATVTVETDSFQLKEGDIILINPHQIHETHGTNCTIAMLQIRLSMFHGPDIHEDANFNCNSSLYPNKERFSNLVRILAEMIHLSSITSLQSKNSLLTISYAYAIMHELMLHFYVPEGIQVHTSETLERLKKITSYIEEHYSENITLSFLAEQHYLSPAYLSHFFEKNMNMTFTAYLTSVRLEHATRELTATTHFIEDIAINNGFPNARSFVTAFRKRYGMLPSQYRLNISEQESSDAVDDIQKQNYMELEKHDFLGILNKYLEEKKTLSQPEAPSFLTNTLSIDASLKGSRLRHTFKKFTSVGRASDLLRSEIQDMLTLQQKEIGYEYIKFHGILDDSMMLYREDASGKPILSYAYVDAALDFLLSIGLRPLIQFSFMPKALAAKPDQQLFAIPTIISPPKDEEKWCYLIESLTKHFINRYGRKEVQKWLFTFWNESLIPTPFSIGDLNYTCHMYELTYGCVKNCDATLRFGNPSTLTTSWPHPPFSQFLSYCRKHNCMPDFHVLHFYPIANSGKENFGKLKREEFLNLKTGDIILSQDPDLLSKYIHSYKIFAKDYPNTPAYLTEWCSTSSHRDWLNDTCFRSAYICKNVLENYDAMDSFGNWTLTDYIEELSLEDNLFHGGMGIFTRNGIKKPAYYAFSFLNQLMDYPVKQGEHYFVTTDGEGNYTILMYNYIHYSSFYAQGILFDASPESRYEAFGETPSLLLDLLLENVENGTYRIKEQIVNRNHGSCYDEWVRMGAMPLTSPEEVNLLKSRSVPMLHVKKKEVKDQRLQYYCNLEPHEIRLVQITKYDA